MTFDEALKFWEEKKGLLGNYRQFLPPEVFEAIETSIRALRVAKREEADVESKLSELKLDIL